MTGSTIYHLHFKESGKDYDYGSIAAIYDEFSPEDIGISQQGLYDFGIKPKRPYSNKICMIRRGEIKRKKGKRKLPKAKNQVVPTQIFSWR